MAGQCRLDSPNCPQPQCMHALLDPVPMLDAQGCWSTAPAPHTHQPYPTSAHGTAKRPRFERRSRLHVRPMALGARAKERPLPHGLLRSRPLGGVGWGAEKGEVQRGAVSTAVQRGLGTGRTAPCAGLALQSRGGPM